MKPLSFNLLNWYDRNARQLPWRERSDAYAIWVSEIMLQQTRVETVIPYYQRWLVRFPSVRALAEASEQDVLAVWEGLGYYSRARNMLKAARVIVDQFGGEFPHQPDRLQELPGIGRYTAAAISSIAFGMNVPVVDGNIKRVFSRIMNIDAPVDSPQTEKEIWRLAAEFLPLERAGDYNQALMDLAADICLPRVPRCLLCPISENCLAYAEGVQETRPVRSPKKSVPHYTVTAAVIRRAGEFLLAKRPADGLLGGLWEFPGGKVEPGESLQECLRREIYEELGAGISVGEEYGVYQHAYTHFRITLHAFQCTLEGNTLDPKVPEEIAWVLPGHLKKYPMGKVDRLIARRLETDG